ncbi:DUF2267 domain-containing protein [Oscillatoria salina]|uniref:DUF2267 domain-containing protein n=1 Tax=Oscillatoria salina TaxID=331517 RepID=UPI0013BA346A|nr:DUF2267 domain-containing protein [Oscillatoria salina]MBZ8180911.1 DUF2267 domain-containing protein [Oscillatoria salina IIICB1]NET89911.1 DUF2267 domain-containing protein [Kamptonema sp. SIO1D9]
MPIALREDVMYILLNKIKKTDHGENGKHQVSFSAEDFGGRRLTKAELLGHLDYLNQKQFINADFSGNAYANQEDVPDAVNPDEFGARVANTFGAEDGPLPHLINFEAAQLTPKGEKMLEKMEANKDEILKEGEPPAPIDTSNMPFLEKVRAEGKLEDIFDARDITVIVYRVMRDLMTTEAADRVAEELEGKEAEPTKDKTLQQDLAELWQDTNPIVGFLSRVRPPWQGPGIFKIDSDRFLFRVANEGSLPKGTNAETAVKAIFSATKEELSSERIEEIGSWMPEGRVKQIWQEA